MHTTLTKAPPTIELSGIEIPGREVKMEERIWRGCYKIRAEAVNERFFPLTLPPGPCRFVLRLTDEDNAENALVEALQKGWNTAPIDALLAIGSHPEHAKIQWHYKIVCLQRSRVPGDSRFPYLHKDTELGGRCLHLITGLRKFECACYIPCFEA